MAEKANKKEEAIKRMKAWGLDSRMIEAFEENGTIYQTISSLGTCFNLDEDTLKRVREFEEGADALVYHVIFNRTEFGDMESLLYVSDIEDWELDWDDIKKSSPMSYVYNLNYPDFSGIGSIGVKLSEAQGLIRFC